MTRSLSPEQITARKAALVDAAMEILESEGHQSLTVRKLADGSIVNEEEREKELMECLQYFLKLWGDRGENHEGRQEMFPGPARSG